MELGDVVYNTEAIVIRTVRYGESNAILTLLTPTGLVSAMAKGAMKPQSRLSAGVRVCAQGTYFLYQGKGMGTVQQVERTASRRRLHEDLEAAAYAAYFCELALHSIPERPTAPTAAYRQFVALLDALEEAQHKSAILARMFETKVSRWLGASPSWTDCIRCGRPLTPVVRYHISEGGLLCSQCFTPSESSSTFQVPPRCGSILSAFERTDFERLGQVDISLNTLRSLDRILLFQLTEFAGLYLKSRTVLDDISQVFDSETEGN